MTAPVQLLVATLCGALTAAPAPALDRVSTEVEATVSAALDRVALRVRTTWTPGAPTDRVVWVLAGDRLGEVPEGLKASTARELYAGKIALGGFEDVRLRVEGRSCAAARVVPEDGAPRLECPLGRWAAAGHPIEVEAEATLVVPERYGPLSRHAEQLTLAGGWYPYVSRPQGPAPRGVHRVVVDLPAAAGAVIGRAYHAPSGDLARARRRLERTELDTTMVPLVVLPPSAGATPAAEDARVVFVSPAGGRVRAAARRTPREEQVVWAATDALRFLGEQGLPLPSREEPLLVVEAPLRHELARATDGPVLVSDRAFRIFPAERFFRFHRLALLRELYTAWALRRIAAALPAEGAARALAHYAADAVGAWLVDRYVAARLGAAESAFDVLSVLSFIPAIDTMLYAPDLPFVGAYFRVIAEASPLVPNLVDAPSPSPRGKVLYEKLLDRLGAEATSRALGRLLAGEPLRAVVGDALGGDAEGFLATWLAPYPSVRYRLESYRAAPDAGDGCSGPGRCWRAEARIRRDGAEVAEPIEVRFVDETGGGRVVRAAATASVVRTVTATLSAPLAEVELDPRGRLAETPSADDPSPRLDNRSSPRWKLLLNNFNVQILASEAAVGTALDVGLSRAYDVRWAHALRADYSPAAVALSGRTALGFGRAVTPARLSSWLGLSVEGAYLRPGFGGGADGCGAALLDSRAFALSAALSLGYDDRATGWAPDAGQAFRATVEYSRSFGDLAECRAGALRAVSPDAVEVVLRGLKAWRLGGAHQLSLRGKLGAFVAGAPREQLLFKLGGRANVRGYRSDARQGRLAGIASAEWLHTLFGELNEDFLHFTWVVGLDGALFADVAVVADDVAAAMRGPPAADVGYGLRLYLDYFGVRPGVMAVDLAFPLLDPGGRPGLGPPAVYIDFSQSFLVF